MVVTFEHGSISGIGDYLNGLNHALHLCELLGFDFVHTTTKLASRTRHSTIEKYIGLSNLDQAHDTIFECSLTLTEGYSLVRDGATVKGLVGKNIRLVFDANDYSNGELFSAVRRAHGRLGYCQTLKDAMRRSPMYTRYLEKMRNKHSALSHHIVVHVRRGDIALAPLALISERPQATTNAPQYYYPITDQLFEQRPFDISTLHQGYRYIDNNAYVRTLLDLKSRLASNESSTYVLLSDGYTVASQGIATKSTDLFGSHIPADLVEQKLNSALDSISALCDYCIIGESPENLERSLVEFLLADYIICGPSCFPLTVRRMVGLPDPEILLIAN